MKTLLCLFILVGIAGCVSTRDVTSNPGSRTDFVSGQTYLVKQPVFLFTSNKRDPKEIPALANLGFGGTSSSLSEFRREAPNAAQVAGLVMPGERIRVSKFVEEKSPDAGTFFNVYAIVISGECKGTVVNLNLISKEARPANKVFRDPKYLEPVN